MIRVEHEHYFAIPVEAGFAFITNTTNWATYWPGYVRLEEGSGWGAVGDTARLTTRLLGRERELTMTITAFEPNRLVAYTSTQPGLPDAQHERHFSARRRGLRVPTRRRIRTTRRDRRSPRPGAAGPAASTARSRARSWRLEREFEVTVAAAVTPRVLIVGAGVAGLALARALRVREITTEVVEGMPAWDVGGAGLNLPGNSVRAFGELGIWPELAARANPIVRQRFLDHRGRQLADIDVRSYWDGVAACVAIRRAALHEGLRAANVGVPVRLGLSVTDLNDDGQANQVHFSDGSTDAYDLVVGADGVHSTIRSLALGGPTARDVGQASWRFVADGFPEIGDWTVMLGRGRAFLTVALGEGSVYCYADVNSRETADPHGTEWRELFVDFADPVPRPPAATRRPRVLRPDRGGRAANLGVPSRRARRRRRPRQLAEHGPRRSNGARRRTPTRRPARDEPGYRRGADRILATTYPPHHMDTGANPPPRPHPKPAPDHPQHHATRRRKTHLPVQLPRPTCSRGYGLGRTYAVNVDSFVRAETYRTASRLHEPMGRRDRAPHRCDPANRPVR